MTDFFKELEKAAKHLDKIAKEWEPKKKSPKKTKRYLAKGTRITCHCGQHLYTAIKPIYGEDSITKAPKCLVYADGSPVLGSDRRRIQCPACRNEIDSVSLINQHLGPLYPSPSIKR